ncbi:RNA polymerase sigma factor SigF [Nocardia higoensis]|uniref:RNA polymerase sigma factor SigF n=1 Tax=Nocardia higoensis TaxID=228599 RepID=A0ABS0D8F3_9NOCA|nr:RNA polymerase sigma factor SigF [Nocardia higoensis]MBF6353129.1 RNA polymerase sigma factor SigF [Nocardia higoensis]
MSATPNTNSSSSRHDGDSYDNLEPWFDKLAALDPADPQRAEMREQIITRCLPLAEHIAARFRGRGIEHEDLQQVAYVGMLGAIDRYDPARGSSFLGFAVPTIMGEVRRHFRDHAWSMRVPRGTKELQGKIAPAVEKLSQELGRSPRPSEIAAELGVERTEITQAMIAANCYNTDSLDATHHDEDGAGTTIAARLGAEEPCYRLLEDAMAVRPLLAALPRRERDVLVMRFFDNLTQAEIAERIGVSQMQVSRILTRTLARLRDQALAEPSARYAAA